MTRKKSEDGKVVFFEKSHKYKLGKVQLTSGTTFLKPYFLPFDAKKIARMLAKFPVNRAKKRGVRYWLNEWKESAEHGTRVHELMENYLYGLDNKPDELEILLESEKIEDRDLNKFKNGCDWLDNYIAAVEPLEPVFKPEYIVYSEELGVAGQIDLLVERLDIKTGDVVYDLLDYKTNKKIENTNFKHEPCFEPLDEFESSNYLKYQLQLSLYAYMLELQGKKIGRLILVHLKEDKTVEYDVEYRPDLIERLIDYDN